MRILIYILIALVALVVAAAIYVRLAPIDAAEWHVDPTGMTAPSTPNFALLTGTTGSYLNAPPAEAGARLQAVAEANGAEVLAGSAEEGHVTYVVRSRVMGFPDFVSVRLLPEGAGTQINIFSRSRYGMSDLGVNTTRVQHWLRAIHED